MKNRCKYFKNYNLIFFVFFSIRDQSVLVIEDLSEKGFRSKDWFKYKLNHQEVLLSLTELAKFHACGLAYRLIIFRESFCLPFYQKHWHFFLHFGTFSRRYCKYFLLNSQYFWKWTNANPMKIFRQPEIIPSCYLGQN